MSQLVELDEEVIVEEETDIQVIVGDLKPGKNKNGTLKYGYCLTGHHSACPATPRDGWQGRTSCTCDCHKEES